LCASVLSGYVCIMSRTRSIALAFKSAVPLCRAVPALSTDSCFWSHRGDCPLPYPIWIPRRQPGPHRFVHLDVHQDVSARTARPPAVKRKFNRRVRLCQSRAEFKLIRLLKENEATRLDKLRNDLEESVERTIRIEQAFVKELSKYTPWSNRKDNCQSYR